MRGKRHRQPGLSGKPFKARRAGGGNEAGPGSFRDRDRNRSDAGIGARLPMEADHLPHVHAIDVVGSKYRDQIGPMPLDQM